MLRQQAGWRERDFQLPGCGHDRRRVAGDRERGARARAPTRDTCASRSTGLTQRPINRSLTATSWPSSHPLRAAPIHTCACRSPPIRSPTSCSPSCAPRSRPRRTGPTSSSWARRARAPARPRRARRRRPRSTPARQSSGSSTRSSRRWRGRPAHHRQRDRAALRRHAPGDHPPLGRGSAGRGQRRGVRGISASVGRLRRGALRHRGAQGARAHLEERAVRRRLGLDRCAAARRPALISTHGARVHIC